MSFKAELNPLNNQNWLISLLDTFSNPQTYPKVFNVKSHHTPDKTCRKLKKIAAHNKIKITWEKNTRNGELTPFLYYSHVYLR